MDNTESLKASLLGLEYGKVATLAMVERGAYAEPEDIAEPEPDDAITGASKFQSSVITDLAQEVQLEGEDLTIVKRRDEDEAMTQADFDWFIEQMTKKKHLVIVECLAMGTTEIKAFLNTLIDKNLLKSTKLVLLDLPTIEFMTLRDTFAGVIEL
ncbi:hypothetical protein [Lactococcus fujiensis]|uniref:Uncharacterized protein n=1 Tax=Lactococcus fujiensis JCM 16395 TaxID=1291764 RepID=A0A2A5RK93_9LACT|nr:hypothetical protein [Lactococcus fujiensis]PCR99638.1 hypothetical protein RT41_GL001751 [Lactococcus fujiensis JCM 16395]